MEEKYYTPKIEEFHVGFEFEFETGIEGWKKFTFNEDRASQLLRNVIDFPTQFRVKFLDKEDIESLGWVNDTINEFRIFYKNENSNIEIKRTYGAVVITVFLGKIKNRSELRRLMQQLSIA